MFAQDRIAIQKLNAVDRLLLAVQEFLQSRGYAGVPNQLHVWCRGRVERATLAEAIERLVQRYPIVASRLVAKRFKPFWRHCLEEQCRLREHSLGGSDDAAVLDHAARLLAEPLDLTRQNPISFHLLHRPDGRDVFLIHHDHVLMDANETPRVLTEIARLSNEPDENGAPQSVASDPVDAYLRRFPLSRRWNSVRNYRSTRSLDEQCETVTLADERPTSRNPAVPRLVMRVLDESQTAFVRSHILRVSGYPSMSMGVLASAFRAVARFTPNPLVSRNRIAVACGVDLRSRSHSRLALCNSASTMLVSAAGHDLDDRDGLVQLLNRQMRDGVKHGYDLGELQIVSWVSRFKRVMRRQLRRQFFRRYSLFYGYFRSSGAPDPFCGTAVEQLFLAAGAWSPPGVTLLVNEGNGRLTLAVTYCPDTVSEQRISGFLDALVSDLLM